MLTAGMLSFNAGGRIINSVSSPTSGGNGYTPLSSIGLATLNAAPAFYTSGLPYTNPLQMLACSESPPVAFVNGMGIDANGKVACDSVGAVASFAGGLPFTAAGALAITTAVGP